MSNTKIWIAWRTDQRREAMLRELQRRRATLADKLRRAADDIEDADYENVPRKSDKIASDQA